jgi:hypothetical protein
MKRFFTLFIAFLTCFATAPTLLSGAASAAGAEVNAIFFSNEKGRLDWGQNYIEATGIGVVPKDKSGAQGKALARRGAIVDLQRNLLEFVVGVRVDATTTMEDFMANDEVRTRVSGMIKNVQVGEGRWDGESYTVSGRVQLPQLLVIVTPSLPPAPPAPKPEAPSESQRSEPASPSSSKSAPNTSGRFTGLVIDARHLSIVPSLSFSVVDESGREVYGINFADPKFSAQSGLAVYQNNLNYAKGELRVAANPIVTKAIRISAGGGIVIPSSDAAKVRGSSYDFRRACKVIIVCK